MRNLYVCVHVFEIVLYRLHREVFLCSCYRLKGNVQYENERMGRFISPGYMNESISHIIQLVNLVYLPSRLLFAGLQSPHSAPCYDITRLFPLVCSFEVFAPLNPKHLSYRKLIFDIVAMFRPLSCYYQSF